MDHNRRDPRKILRYVKLVLQLFYPIINQFPSRHNKVEYQSENCTNQLFENFRGQQQTVTTLSGDLEGPQRPYRRCPQFECFASSVPLLLSTLCFNVLINYSSRNIFVVNGFWKPQAEIFSYWSTDYLESESKCLIGLSAGVCDFLYYRFFSDH